MRFWGSASLAALLISSVTAAGLAQAPGQISAPRKPAVHRKFNELTLAGLRPGRDNLARAIRLFGKPDTRSADQQSAGWSFETAGGAFYLNLDLDKADVVQFIRVSTNDGPSGVALPKHGGLENRSWTSGRGLVAGSSCGRVVQLYGEPDSRSPSTKAGQQLELMYYAFDWAGADVPQVMEVLCSVPPDGKPGRVVEITLAAPSL
jgi:hypothetical protein